MTARATRRSRPQVCMRSKGRLSGNTGAIRQIKDKSHGNRTGYFVCGGDSGRLMM